YGADGNIWGGEFLIADLKNYRRYTHFEYVPMPGGDRAVDEPWRMAYSYLYKYSAGRFDFESVPAFRTLDSKKLAMTGEMLGSNLNSPLSSGAGRLFDAVSALLGLCTISNFDSEAPMRLESAADEKTDDFYRFEINDTVVFSETINEILGDLPDKKIPVISAKFHNTIARVILMVSIKIREETSLNKVVLSGGVFQNKYLLEKAVILLRRNRFKVFTNHLVPSNDGGISLGQLVIASKLIR
ncbi:MAG: carbamoyltransferase HypF, partial [Bacteroidales bacterium]|nr:carbamoyltransferase HypF [Bacteroidales bacterium]